MTVKRLIFITCQEQVVNLGRLEHDMASVVNKDIKPHCSVNLGDELCNKLDALGICETVSRLYLVLAQWRPDAVGRRNVGHRPSQRLAFGYF